MAAITTDIQGLTAAGVGASAARWSAGAAVPASKRHHSYVIAAMPFTADVKNVNGITRRPTEGSS